MKHVILTVLLLAAVGAAAQEPQIIVQHLDLNPKKTLMITVSGEYTTVYIYQDTVDYVSILTPNTIDTTQITQPLFKYEEKTNLPDELTVGGFGAYTVFEIHLKTEKLYLYNRLYNRVTFSSAAGYGHKLKYKLLSVQTDDYSMVDIESPLEAEDIRMIAEKNSLIRYHSYTADNYSENTKENAIIYGGARNGESLASKRHVTDYKTEGYKPFSPKRLRYSPAQRIHLRLSSALLSGGRSQWSGFGDVEENHNNYTTIPYPAMKTTWGSHQVELGYDIICRNHIALNIGVGYSYSHYEFKDPYVDYVGEYEYEGSVIPIFYLSPSVPPYGGGDSLQNWSTHLTSNYITFPISLTYYADRKHHKGFHISAAIVPGFGLGQGRLRSRYCQWEEDPVDHQMTGMIINDNHMNDGEMELFPTVDYRLTVGWARWSLMLQISDASSWSFTFAANRLSPFHPFRLGVMLDL